MNNILIFSGTSEGRELSELLSQAGISHTLCVATEYGKQMMTDSPCADVRTGRMNEEEMTAFIKDGSFSIIIDATHPYATEVTENIKKSASETGIKYLRLLRKGLEGVTGSYIHNYKNDAECIEALKKTEGNILLTVGSKELSSYVSENELAGRLYARIIPSVDSIRICNNLGITGKNIIAMQGPFSTEMNEAIIDQFMVKHMVSKQSGNNGGFPEKLKSVQNKEIDLYVIGCSENPDGSSFDEVISELEKELDLTIPLPAMKINLIGTGMGSEECLTLDAKQKIEESSYIFGDKRVISSFDNSDKEVHELYLPKDVIPFLIDIRKKDKYKKKSVSVLFSGDASFYSGASKMYDALKNEKDLNADISIIPGISSVSFLSSRLGVSYNDAVVASMHGRQLSDLLSLVKHNNKVFLLLSGKKDVNEIGLRLKDGGLKDIRVTLGIDLASDRERIITLSSSECISFNDDSIITCLIINDRFVTAPASHGISDDEFIRQNVPMTKEEIREVSISKLHLYEDSIVYDVGSGTGSISVECGRLSGKIKVYAIEKNEEAILLTKNNAKKFNLENVYIVKGSAPEVLEGLPVPTHAFIGGSGGNLDAILEYLYSINTKMRIVLNAVSIETIGKIESIPDRYSVEHFELVQLQVSRSSALGSHHLMKAENPVWICSFDFK